LLRFASQAPDAVRWVAQNAVIVYQLRFPSEGWQAGIAATSQAQKTIESLIVSHSG
jgi:hypothetical protein